MEAFALLVLVNNYKAWLYEEKKTHKADLWTKYDCPPSFGKPSIVDKNLDGVQSSMFVINLSIMIKFLNLETQ